MIRYCDGSSFTGNSKGMYNGTKLYFKGARIFESTLKVILEKGMKSAKNRPTKMLPKSCTSKFTPAMCFFAQNVQQDIKTPIFFIMSEFDFVEIGVTTGKQYDDCMQSKTCTSDQINVMQDLRLELLNVLPKQDNQSSRGLLILSSYGHVHMLSPHWYEPAAGTNKGIAATRSYTQLDKSRLNWPFVLLFLLLSCSHFTANAQDIRVNPTELRHKGAATYYFAPGSDEGVHNWVVFLPALLVGESSGGVAVMLHCDRFRKKFSSSTHVKCLSDGGYFFAA
nr:pectin acetylesterase 7-like isoform X1 [Ipomoea trifida]